MTSFADLGVPHDVVRTLNARGIDAPFPIQALTIADGLAGRDVSGKARTGSGKTLAFGIPMVARISKASSRRPTALVLVPTRELAKQVCGELTWLGKGRKLRAFSVYGGAAFGPQLTALRRGTEMLVACPGRLLDLIGRGEVDLGGVEIVVVDEADRMADMGFLPDVRRILDLTPDTRQTLLFSATLDGAIDTLVHDYQRDPVRHEIPEDPDDGARVEHHFWKTDRDARVALTADIIRASGPTIVFCRTKHGTDGLAKKLGRMGVRTETIHGNRSQGQRERALDAFARGKVPALLATDVAARGIHVDGVECVIHFDIPADEKDYTHRSGRTARAGATGTVVTLVMADQVKGLRRMQRTLDLPEGVTAPDLHALAAPVATGSTRSDRSDREADAPMNRAARRRARFGDVRDVRDVRDVGDPFVPSGPVRGETRPVGTLKFFDTKRGFGFIDRGTGTDLFVHHSGLDVAGHRLSEGALVEFDIEPGRRGEEARNVRLARV